MHSILKRDVIKRKETKMIDLKELERSLDEALANETTESLNEWLTSQRNRHYGNYFGDGSFEEIGSNNYTYNQETPTDPKFVSCNKNNPSTELAKAA